MSMLKAKLQHADRASLGATRSVRAAHATTCHAISSGEHLASPVSLRPNNLSCNSASSSGVGAPFRGVNKRAIERLRLSKRSQAGIASAAAPGQVLKTVTVELGDRAYPIYIGNGLLANNGELLRKHIPGKRVLVVTNETVAPLYLDKCVKALSADGKLQVESVVLPDGEAYKTLDVLQAVWDKALESKMDRGTTFVALGGGVIGDMTGFAASCYQRGVYFVQVPTTVMSQVDSSVGGKTGVNHPLGKNMIGAFYQPQVVLIDSDSLSTLPNRELASGFSEIIKYGLIRDAPLFDWLEANMDKLLARDPEAIAYAIERSCINKAEVVAADEREINDIRATLNLGHTFGHAIENFAGYGNWLHGEAVAAGTCMAADLSWRLGWIDKSLYDRTVAIMARARLPVKPPPEMTSADFKNLMSVDKKVHAGKLRFVLLKGPLGNSVVSGEFEPAKLDETLLHFCGK